MAFEIRYYNALIHDKDDIEFVNEVPCFLGHLVVLSLHQTFQL